MCVMSWVIVGSMVLLRCDMYVVVVLSCCRGCVLCVLLRLRLLSATVSVCGRVDLLIGNLRIDGTV